MKVNIDSKGPFGYNEELSKFIEKNGNLLSDKIPEEIDPKYNNDVQKYGVDLKVLHIPTGKTCDYQIYLDYGLNRLRTFNGWFDDVLEEEFSEFKWIYSKDYINN